MHETLINTFWQANDSQNKYQPIIIFMTIPRKPTKFIQLVVIPIRKIVPSLAIDFSYNNNNYAGIKNKFLIMQNGMQRQLYISYKLKANQDLIEAFTAHYSHIATVLFHTFIELPISLS